MLLCYNYVNAQTLCDSLSYSIGTSSVLMVIGTNNSSDSVNFMWGVCDNSVCYSASGDTAYFPLLNTLDTVKVCFDISPQWMCTDCSYFTFNGFSWLPLSNTVGWEEILPNGQHKGVTYDLKGRAVHNLKKNTIYIRNMKKFITL